jgi:hypothetical protein
MNLPRPSSPSSRRRLAARAADLLADRQGPLPVWVRAPKRGHEFYTGCTRPKLYEWAAKGYIRSTSIREPGQVKGVRLFHLQSILDFIEKSEKEVAASMVLTQVDPCIYTCSGGI